MGSKVTLVLAGLIRGLCDCTVTLASAALMDLSPSPAQYSKNFVWIGVAGGCGIVVGPAVGALVGLSSSLVQTLLFFVLYCLFLITHLCFVTQSLPFVVSATIEGLNCLWLLGIVPETTTMRRQQQLQAIAVSKDPTATLMPSPNVSPRDVMAEDEIAEISFGAAIAQAVGTTEESPRREEVKVSADPANAPVGKAAVPQNLPPVTWRWSHLNPFRTFKILFVTPYVL
jgi:MFS family permease